MFGDGVMTNYESMNLYQFQKQFTTNEKCEEYLFKLKWPDGYVCKKCGCKHYFTTKTRNLNLFECAQCGYQATVIVDTIFAKTRTELTKWFIAIFLFAYDKRSISSSMLSKQIDVTYKTAWLMLHKIRHSIQKHDEKYTLSGIIELDDAYIGAPTEGEKRGRGTEQTKIIVGLSLNKKGHPQYLKINVIDDIKGSTIVEFAKKAIQPNSEIHSDGYRSYLALTKEGYKLENQVYDPKKNPDHLHWLHIIISNLKSFISGTYHGLDSKYLQAYIDEFCYRFNRRKHHSTIFNRLLSCCAQNETIKLSELRG